ncbi:MAG: SH3-like domain-containing protein [Geminicoccaceae bacterium]
MTSGFKVGDAVRVREAFPPGHVRTPHYVRGCAGIIESIAGAFADPEELAYGRDGLPAKTLYRVRFHQSDVWPDYAGPKEDTLVVDVYDHWLLEEPNP